MKVETTSDTIFRYNFYVLIHRFPLFLLKINVVTEKRLYQKWCDKSHEEGGICIDTGLMKARRALNEIHIGLQKNGFTEVSTVSFYNRGHNVVEILYTLHFYRFCTPQVM